MCLEYPRIPLLRCVTFQQVPGVSSIQTLSVTQLNSEESFVASITLNISTPINGAPSPAENGTDAGRLAAAVATTILNSVKSILTKHNIGRNTVEILPQGQGPAYGSSEETIHVISGEGDRGHEHGHSAAGAGDAGEVPTANGGHAHAHSPHGADINSHDGHAHDGHSHAHSQGHGEGHGERQGHARSRGHSPQVHGANFSGTVELV